MGIQKIAKIDSGSVKKRFRVGVELNVFSCRDRFNNS
jgi:hypothetical protein